MRVLITGAAGGFGAPTVARLRAQGAQVVGLDTRAGDGILACDITDGQAALRAFPARPLLDQSVDRFPTAQIEVADTEVGALRDLQRVPERWQEVAGDFVKNARHWRGLGFRCARWRLVGVRLSVTAREGPLGC